MMSCAQITEQVTAYLDRSMPLRQRMAFQMHMWMCTHCRRYLRQVRTTVALTGRLPTDPIPEDVREDLVRALMAIHTGGAEPVTMPPGPGSSPLGDDPKAR